MEFALDEVYNLLQLKTEIINKTYKFSGYISFTVTEPKERPVNAPHYRDKIVQLAMNNILKEIYNPKFIHDSYACIDDKGTHECAKRAQYFMRKARWEYGDGAYIVKIDMQKFFYSIVRGVLKELISDTIKDKNTLELFYIIIDSAGAINVVGMPLGNVLSQLSANIYLNVVDQYAKRNLGLKYYIRYMDDIVVIAKDKEKAKEVMELLRVQVESKLGINLNENKSKIFPLAQGVNFIGFKIYATHMLLRNDSKKKIKRKIKAMPRLIREGRLTVRKAEQMLNSWKGHADHADSYNFIQSLIKKHDFIYADKKGKLRINIKRLETVEE